MTRDTKNKVRQQEEDTRQTHTHLDTCALIDREDLQCSGPSFHSDRVAVPRASDAGALRAQKFLRVERRVLLDGKGRVSVRQVDGRTEDAIVDLHESRVLITNKPLEG